jgi:hypothetical protein
VLGRKFSDVSFNDVCDHGSPDSYRHLFLAHRNPHPVDRVMTVRIVTQAALQHERPKLAGAPEAAGFHSSQKLLNLLVRCHGNVITSLRVQKAWIIASRAINTSFLVNVLVTRTSTSPAFNASVPVVKSEARRPSAPRGKESETAAMFVCS